MMEAITRVTTQEITRDITQVVNVALRELGRGNYGASLEISADGLHATMLSHNIVLSKTACLILASALEYLAREILTLSADTAGANTKFDT